MSLNPDHTHFLLVDDGTQGQCGAKEVQFRARLERVIADKPNIQRQSKWLENLFSCGRKLHKFVYILSLIALSYKENNN